MYKFKKITIEWSYPKEFESVLIDSRMNDIGIYYITRKFGSSESNLYIGKTTYSFISRLDSHKWNWLNDYRGKKCVRLGKVITPKNISNEELYQLINDAERTLIYTMSDRLKKNIVSTQTCNPNYRLKITNVGYRGGIPSEVYIPDKEWIEEEFYDSNILESQSF
jgi:hypothetical protein